MPLRPAKGTAHAARRPSTPPLTIDAIFPGTRAKYRPGSALRMHWPSMPYAKGSYACFLPDQARFSGHEAEPVGYLYFAGEHTSEEFQGYMNGAVESGRARRRAGAVGLAATFRVRPAARQAARLTLRGAEPEGCAMHRSTVHDELVGGDRNQR